MIGSGPKQDKVTDSIRTGFLPSGGSGERVGALAQNCEIPPVTENAAPSAASNLLDYAKPLQIGERRIDRRGRKARLLNELVGRQIGILLKEPARSLSAVMRSRSSLNNSTIRVTASKA